MNKCAENHIFRFIRKNTTIAPKVLEWRTDMTIQGE